MSARTLNLAKFIGLIEMIGGIAAFILQGWSAYQSQLFTYQFPSLVIASALMFMAGLFLYNEERRGLILSFIILALQLIGFHTQYLSYDLFLLPVVLDIRLLNINGVVEFTWNASIFDTGLSFAFEQVKQGWRITLHLVTCLLIWLLYRIWREDISASESFPG